MKHLYFFIVDQETHVILCNAPNYEIANKLCEYVLNTSVMRIRTSSVYNPSNNQILLQQNIGMVRPGEGSVAKPSDIEESYQIEDVILQLNHKSVQLKKAKKILEIKLECLIMIYDMAEKFMSRYTDMYLNYSPDMVQNFANGARISFQEAKKYIDWQNDCYNYGKSKIDGCVFRLILEVDNIIHPKDLPVLKRKIDNAVYVN